MTTPKRPSLADTLAHIDAVLDASDERITDLAKAMFGPSLPPCLVCARQALRDSPYCAAHKRIPREMIEELGRVEPVTRDGADDEATAEVLRIVQDDFARHEREYLYGPPLNVRPRGGITENGQVTPWPPYLQPALDEVARHLSGPPGPTCPGCAARDAQPGWLGRTLRRLFT